jgi:hypothetical protein
VGRHDERDGVAERAELGAQGVGTLIDGRSTGKS